MDAIVTLRVRLKNMVDIDGEYIKNERQARKAVKEIIQDEGIGGLVAQGYFGVGGPYEVKRVEMVVSEKEEDLNQLTMENFPW